MDSLHVAEEPRRVLVTGGAGFVGSALVPRLLARGHSVVAYDSLLYGLGALEGVAHHPKLRVVVADLRHQSRLEDELSGVDAVVHLAGIVGEPACQLDVARSMEVNQEATRQLAVTASSLGVRRFVFASTCAVYPEADTPLDESGPVVAGSPYVAAKLDGEKVLASLTGEEFRPVVLRLASLYGLARRRRFDLAVNRLTAQAVREGRIVVHGGEQWRPFVHVEDVARAIELALTVPIARIGGRIINVGSDAQNATIRNVAERIAGLVYGARVALEPGDGLEGYRVSFREARDRLGFVPGWTIEAGIRQVLSALSTSEQLDYRDPTYSNVESLRLQHGTACR